MKQHIIRQGRTIFLGTQRMFRSLRHPNFRLYFAGQLLSLIGSWMSSLALSWLVYRLTSSEILLGAVSFATQFPAVIFSPIGGVIVDRVDERKLLCTTQCLSMLQSFAIAALILMGLMTPALILWLSLLQGIINGFDMPARQSLLPRLVNDRADLANAIALQSATFNAARLIGPMIGGLIIGWSSEATCFTVDGISFLAVLVSLFLLKLPKTQKNVASKSFRSDFADGIQYITKTFAVRSLLLLVCVVAFFGTTLIVLLPVYVREVFSGGPELLGWLMSASGLGALSAALFLAARHRLEGIGKIMSVMMFILAPALCAAAIARSPWMNAPFLVLNGFCLIGIVASCNTILQAIVPDTLRGRVMSFYSASFFASMPLGNLLMGFVAEHSSARIAVAISGIALIPAAILFARALPEIRKQARQLHENRHKDPRPHDSRLLPSEGATELT